MVRVRLVCALLPFVACGPTAMVGSALRFDVNLDAGLRSTCVAISITQADGTQLKRSKGARIQGRTSLQVGIFKDDLPDTVKLQAIGFADVECTMETTPAERSAIAEATFPESGPKDLPALRLSRVALGTDVDKDLSPADVDCDDFDATVRPGIPENCTDGKDNNCDALRLKDCGDPECSGKQCKQLGSVCLATGLCGELGCADGMDNDGDGMPDCGDSDCTGKPCQNGGTCGAGSCMNATSESGLCSDGRDNDNDSKIDCEDNDCNAQTCNDGVACNVEETCQANRCQGGRAVVCGAPTNVCLGASGTCSEALDGGCAYPALTVDAGCDDGLLCTANDHCDGDGGCTGTPVICASPPPGPCWDLSGFCNEDAGCTYSIVPGLLGCTDNDPCTVNDACLADAGCLGTMLDCSNATPPNECQTSTGVCASGACTFTNRTGSCTGGTCIAGDCVLADGGAGLDGGNDGGALDAGSIDAGALDAGPGFLPPSNVPISVINGQPPYAHLNYTCNTTLSLNPLSHVPNALGCTPPALPQVVTLSQNGAPSLSVIVVDRLTVASGVTLTIVPGTGGSPADKAPVIAVRGDATVNGSIVVSSMFSANPSSGPGGEGSWCPTPTLGTSQTDRSGGGQGGAFGAGSGTGGRGADNGGTGAPALSANGNDTLVPLRGGCTGSRGGNSSSGQYGRAGGALQLWVRGTLSIGGSIVANGGRGLNSAALIAGGGGGGGGSGGGLLLEATTLNIGNSAIIAANGGSGAQGTSWGWGADGRPGAADVVQALGGSGANVCGGPGGMGGARAGGATGGSNGDPQNNCTNLGGGGGGGGSVGRIRFNALTGCTIGQNAKVSPPSSSALASCRF